MTNECVSIRSIASMFSQCASKQLIEDDYVGQAFTAQRSDETLSVRVRQCEYTHMKNTG
jgi:hypothetical protein